MDTDSKVYVAGHRGMVGSAVVRRLKDLGCNDLVVRTSGELDLTSQVSVNKFFCGRATGCGCVCGCQGRRDSCQ